MQVELNSPCKVNFILNILGRRPDGFHELETVMHPVPYFDRLQLERRPSGIELACNIPELPCDAGNLVYRAAEQFLLAIGSTDGVCIRLEKRIALAAGLGGGSGNAATTLLGMNQLFGRPLPESRLEELAARLGSDVPFFLQRQPALATGRGEKIESLQTFASLKDVHIVLVHPGFGISTPWAYKNLARFPKDLNGEKGRARQLVKSLESSLNASKPWFYNSLEAPVLEKFPLLAIFRDFLAENGATVAMMSGSGSTIFGLAEGKQKSEYLVERFKERFGEPFWVTNVPMQLE